MVLVLHLSNGTISIHALREEGDQSTLSSEICR